jgi:hypothetical protein
MPQDTRVRTRAVRDHMKATGLTYTAAMAAIDAPFKPGYISISECMQQNGYSYGEAVAFLADPANELLCEVCGWTNGMICPECSGCGCNHGCTGWRHREYADEDDDDPSGRYCTECGANSHYDCYCWADDPDRPYCGECGAGTDYECTCP